MNAPAPLLDAQGRYRRPAPAATGPDRRAGGFYRSADDAARRVIGRPLQSTEDAVVAAVRMAYDVADEQIDRGIRLAGRLKTAGDAAIGSDSERQALQGAEQLALRLGGALLAWLETAAAEPGSPLLRLLGAEYRLIGRALGILEPAASAPAGAAPPSSPAGVPRPQAAGGAPDPLPALLAAAEGLRPLEAKLRFLHAPGQEALTCVFRPPGQGEPVQAMIEGHPRLRALVLRLPDLDGHDAGRWMGAIRDGEGVQVGLVELELF